MVHVTAERLEALDGGSFLEFVGTDGMRWMQAFRALNPTCNVEDDVMLGWFCNAIMAGHDAALGNPPLNGDHAQWLIDRDAPKPYSETD
jgi:hypothetical protein